MTITMSKMTKNTKPLPAIVADLHIHSTASDGEYTPAEIAAVLESRHISVAALADHDSFSGFREFKKAYRGTAIPAVELSVSCNNIGFHLLSYGFDPENRKLIERLKHFQQVRKERIQKMCERLADMGLPVSMDDIRKNCPPGTTLGRPHIARAMLAAGYIKSFNMAFHKYIGDGKDAYIPKARMDFEEARELIRISGGISILAHPGLYHKEIALEKLLQLPVDGFEAYHPNHSPGYTRSIINYCLNHQLPYTGGSDFHDLRKNKTNVIGKWGLLEKEWGPLRSYLQEHCVYDFPAV